MANGVALDFQQLAGWGLGAPSSYDTHMLVRWVHTSAQLYPWMHWHGPNLLTVQVNGQWHIKDIKVLINCWCILRSIRWKAICVCMMCIWVHTAAVR